MPPTWGQQPYRYGPVPPPGGGPQIPLSGRGRVPGWLWPAVTALALAVGLLGGALGGLAYESLQDDNSSTNNTSSDGVDTSVEAPLSPDNGSVSAVAKALLPSTVQIIATTKAGKNGFTGSGFVLDREGHIVTNNHVVAAAAVADKGTIEIVDQEGNHYGAKVVGRSPVYDLAVLYVAEATELRPAALGASRSLRVGEEVVAFGSPLGLTSTVTAGIVSAINRPVTTGDSADETSYINAVQTDAAINPGNSGGPLVNLAGEVVGVNSAIATTGGGSGESGNIGVGFAIPIEQVRVTAEQILTDGEAKYPVIGATVQTGRVDTVGAVIDQVLDGTPAARAGLRKDDVITEIDGDRVVDGIALIVAIRTHQPGDTVTFTLTRDGRERRTDVTLDAKVG